jgi:hypothetical protein
VRGVRAAGSVEGDRIWPIFTHCGRAIVAGPPDVEALVSRLGRARGTHTRIAYDDLRIRMQ